MYRLLDGLQVVECDSFIAAPSCGLHLAQLGATVLRIDSIGGGPDFRRWPVASNGCSLYWEGLNKGKQSIAVDFSKPRGRELIVDLITASGSNRGVFVTNFPKDGFLSHRALRQKRRDLITVRVTGWSDGAAAVDYTVNAALGLPYMTGSVENGNNPVNHVLPAWDLLTGAYAAVTCLAAERHRRDTQQGGEVIVPLSDVALASMGHMGQIAEALIGGDRPRFGNALFGAFGRDFVTADGERVMVVAITAKQWSALLDSLDLQTAVASLEEELQVSFAHDEGVRFTHREALFGLFERAIVTKTLSELRTKFEAGGVCWSAYQTLGAALHGDPRLSPDPPLFNVIDQPSGLRYPAPGAAATIEGMPREPVVRAPRLGEHTDQILAEVLSLTSAAIGALHDDRIVSS